LHFKRKRWPMRRAPRTSWGPALRSSVGAAFLLLQLGLIGWCRLHAKTLPYWAPNDFLVDYQIRVVLPSGPLDERALLARYGLWPQGSYEYPADALIAIVERREQALGPRPAREVRVRYRLNGHEPITWTWRSP
jgi:hypothetical protein